MGHLDTETILAYVTQNLGEKETYAADCHLAECPDCARQVKAQHMLRDNFDFLWDSWTAKEHGMVLARARVEEALQLAIDAIGETRPDLTDRIGNCLSALAGKTRASLSVTLDSARQQAQILRQQLTEAVMPNFVPAAVAITGPERPSPAITVETREGVHIEVTADAAGRVVSICTPMLDRKPWPLVFLIPKGGGPALLGEFHRPLETETLLAEFEDVADGEYLLVLEGDPDHEVAAG